MPGEIQSGLGPAEVLDRSLPQPLPAGLHCRASRLILRIKGFGKAAGETIRIARNRKQAVCPKELPSHGSVERDGRQANGHVVEQLSCSFGQAELGRHRSVAKRKQRGRLRIGHSPGEGDMLGDPEFAALLLVQSQVRKAHEQQVRVGMAGEEPLHRLQEQACSLVLRQQAEVHDEVAVGWDAKLGSQGLQCCRVVAVPGTKTSVLTASGSARTRSGGQSNSSMRRRSAWTDEVRIRGDRALIFSSSHSKSRYPRLPVLTKPWSSISRVIDTLEIEDHGHTKGTTEHQADERAFVQVGVNDVVTPSRAGGPGTRAPRTASNAILCRLGPHLEAAAARDWQGAAHVKPCNFAPVMIG